MQIDSVVLIGYCILVLLVGIESFRFFKGEKFALRLQRSKSIVKALSDYVYLVEYLRNCCTSEIHACRFRFYTDSDLNTEAIMTHVLSSETGMVVSRLMKLVETSDDLMVQVYWKGLSDNDDTIEPISKINEEVPVLFHKLFERKATPSHLVDLVKQQLSH